MMTAPSLHKQSGAVLFVALIMLLVLTVVSISAMRGVSLESRLTGGRTQVTQLQDAADATLREAELRFYGAGYLRDKLEPNATNCNINNQQSMQNHGVGMNKPCLLSIVTTPPSLLRDFTLDPIILTESNKSAYLNSVSQGGLAWMPYRGRHPGDTAGSPVETVAIDSTKGTAGWNTYLITGGPADEAPLNVEYGATGEGRGTYFYLVNGKVDTTAAQSTIANVYVGLNN